MALINPTLPSPSSPRGDEENDTRAALVTILNEFNGNIDAANVKDNSLTVVELLTASMDILTPPATLAGYGGAVAPAGWLFCDGAAVSRSTFARLFTALGGAGSPWGLGDGSTTFNVPDLKGRTMIGAGTGSGLSARAVGGSAGTEPVNMPTHNHPLVAGGAVLSDAGGAFTVSGTDVTGIRVTTIGNTANPGGDNMPPFKVVNMIIRTGNTS